jgi:hypothetical protein
MCERAANMALSIINSTFVIPLMSLAFSFATFCRWSSMSCCFFGRMAKCFKPSDSGVDELRKRCKRSERQQGDIPVQ